MRKRIWSYYFHSKCHVNCKATSENQNDRHPKAILIYSTRNSNSFTHKALNSQRPAGWPALPADREKLKRATEDCGWVRVSSWCTEVFTDKVFLCMRNVVVLLVQASGRRTSCGRPLNADCPTRRNVFVSRTCPYEAYTCALSLEFSSPSRSRCQRTKDLEGMVPPGKHWTDHQDSVDSYALHRMYLSIFPEVTIFFQLIIARSKRWTGNSPKSTEGCVSLHRVSLKARCRMAESYLPLRRKSSSLTVTESSLWLIRKERESPALCQLDRGLWDNELWHCIFKRQTICLSWEGLRWICHLLTSVHFVLSPRSAQWSDGYFVGEICMARDSDGIFPLRNGRF